MTILFCQECNNMLYPKQDSQNKILLYACRHCDHQQEATHSCVYRNDVRHIGKDFGVDYRELCSDPTLPRVYDADCPNGDCLKREAVFFMSRNIQRDTPLTLEFVCCGCYSNWKLGQNKD